MDNIPYTIEIDPDNLRIIMKESDIASFICLKDPIEKSLSASDLIKPFITIDHFSNIQNNLFSDAFKPYYKFFSRDEINRLISKDFSDIKLSEDTLKRICDIINFRYINPTINVSKIFYSEDAKQLASQYISEIDLLSHGCKNKIVTPMGSRFYACLCQKLTQDNGI